MSTSALQKKFSQLARRAYDRDVDYGVDFSGVSANKPAAVVQASNESELKEILAHAKRSQIPVSIRGAGHSCNGQTLSPEGLVIVNRTPEAKVRLKDNGSVEVDTSASWASVERRLNRAGRANPVLTDVLSFTVGGTLSVGGIGVASIQHGCQVDQVESLRLVTPDGVALTCSPTENTQLFRYALASCGAVGVITKVTLKTVPLIRNLKLHYFGHPDLKDLIQSLQWIPEARSLPDTCWGAQFRAGKSGDVPAMSEYGFAVDRDPNKNATLKRILRSAQDLAPVVSDYPFDCERRREDFMAPFTDHCAVWEDYVLTPSAALEFAAAIDERTSRKRWARNLEVAYVLVLRKSRASVRPAFSPVGKSSKFFISIGLYFMVPRDDVQGLRDARQTLQWAQDFSARSGGRPYLYGFNTMNDELRRRLYGSDFDRLNRLRETSGWAHFSGRGPMIEARA